MWKKYGIDFGSMPLDISRVERLLCTGIFSPARSPFATFPLSDPHLLIPPTGSPVIRPLCCHCLLGMATTSATFVIVDCSCHCVVVVLVVMLVIDSWNHAKIHALKKCSKFWNKTTQLWGEIQEISTPLKAEPLWVHVWAHLIKNRALWSLNINNFLNFLSADTVW